MKWIKAALLFWLDPKGWEVVSKRVQIGVTLIPETGVFPTYQDTWKHKPTELLWRKNYT